MNINTDTFFVITELKRFSRVICMADENDAIVIFKNNMPWYLLIKFRVAEEKQTAKYEDVLAILKRLIETIERYMRLWQAERMQGKSQRFRRSNGMTCFSRYAKSDI